MDKFKIITKKSIDELPKHSGVYCFISEGKTIYIGKAINIKNRVKNHFNQSSYRDDLFIDKVDKIGYFETYSEIEALILEANLIKKYQPKFNVVWRDDKNYFFVAINRKAMPYVFITHQKNSPKTDYIGPFVEGTALKKTLKYLRRAFPYYTVGPKGHPHQKTKCTYCHLDLCPGPTPDLVEYKKNIKKLTLILQGKRGAVLNSLKKDMKGFSKKREFEKAAEIRDRISDLQQVMSHSGVIESTAGNPSGSKEYTSGQAWLETQKILQNLLNINKPISKIECYDVSNIQGKSATGSMVTFINGSSDKTQYKKFKINLGNTPNDISMLKETIERRLSHKEWPYPEIMLIDGGIAQLNVAINAKNATATTKNIKVISIAKRDKDLYIEGKHGFIPLKSLPREIYNLVLQLDDEAHRFAIAYHKKLRKDDLLK